jgi:hypothetical protein
MGLILAVSTLYVPPFVRKRSLAKLFKATAEAFETTVPATRNLSHDECLKMYAQFTREQADKSIRQGKQLETQSRLFQNACGLGRQLKADFKVNTPEDVMRMAKLVYRILKIDFQGEPEGNITIKRCFFSAYYSSQVCRLISSLDEGLLVGLAGGGKLSFSGRITEGDECCRAFLEIAGRQQ